MSASTADAGASALASLAARGVLEHAVALVTAHPDDEAVGLGGVMAQFETLSLLQLTDGAPLDATAVARAGFATRQAYAAARRGELVDALQAMTDSRLSRLICYEIPDGSLVAHLDIVIERLIEDLVWVEAVFTHPFEGGHADHDVAAFAVQTACARLSREGSRAPVRLEFTSYHCHMGLVTSGRFLDDPACPEIAVALTPQAARRKEAAFACHRTQADNLRFFGFGAERFRRAPTYDFTRPPVAEPMYGLAEWERLAETFATRSG